MNQEYREIVTSNRSYLKDNLVVSEEMLAYLRDDKIITEDDEEILMKAKQTRNSRINCFVDLIVKRSPKAFESFLKSLILSDQTFVAEHLHKTLTEKILNDPEALDGNIREEEDEEVPDSSNTNIPQDDPDREDDARIYNGNDSDEDDDEGSIAQNIEDGPPVFDFKICYELTFPKNNCYQMNSSPRGKVLVYNNAENRRGSEFDVKNLKNIFLKLGYKVKIIEKCRAEIFKNILREECNGQDMKLMDSFILFVMTHGVSKHLCMQDGETVSLDYVEEQLDGKNAPLLVNKPKLIFIQACRDGDKSRSSQLEHDALEELQPHYKADILLSHSTYKGCKSGRLTDKGTVFIRALVLVLEKHAHEWSYSDIMICVQRIVGRVNIQNHTQIPQKTDSARYNFFFSPIKITSLLAQADS